ncbi:MAG: type II toxin-antitoxin system RelE/ParE family toxin [Terricaulis sp.]
MRRIEITRNASADLDDIVAYIAQDNPIAAERVDQRVRAAIEKLAEASTGRAGRVAGTFEKLVKGAPYVIAYELADKATLRVLRIIHGARDWQAGQWPD